MGCPVAATGRKNDCSPSKTKISSMLMPRFDAQGNRQRGITLITRFHFTSKSDRDVEIIRSKEEELNGSPKFIRLFENERYVVKQEQSDAVRGGWCTITGRIGIVP